MKTLVKTIAIAGILSTSFATVNVMAVEAKAVAVVPAAQSLYDRIGGEKVSRAIVEDIWTNHKNNPIVKGRFLNSDPEYVKQRVFEIFAAATGGDVEYKGMDLAERHSTMNVSEMEFNAAVDDIMAAMTTHNIAQKEKDEVLVILWSVRPAIVNTFMTTKALTAKESAK
jgi:hemoglobin